MEQQQSKAIINEKVYEDVNYSVFFSWYPSWPDELHYHFDISRATSTVIREINELADVLTEAMGVEGMYTLIEAGSKEQEHMCRLLHAEPYEEYELEGQTYYKYFRRK